MRARYLARLSDYDLAIFVSASAVRAAQPLLSGAWPSGTMIGAVGASTRAAVEAELDPPAGVVISAADEDQQSGSEAFWGAWLRDQAARASSAAGSGAGRPQLAQ